MGKALQDVEAITNFSPWLLQHNCRELIFVFHQSAVEIMLDGPNKPSASRESNIPPGSRCRVSQCTQPHLEDTSTYRGLRPTKLECQWRGDTGPLGRYNGTPSALLTGFEWMFGVNYFCRRIASPKSLPNAIGCLK